MKPTNLSPIVSTTIDHTIRYSVLRASFSVLLFSLFQSNRRKIDMSKNKIVFMFLAMTAFGTGIAFADGNHGHGDKSNMSASGSMAQSESAPHSVGGGADMHGMMQKMMSGDMHKMMRMMMNSSGAGMMDMMRMHGDGSAGMGSMMMGNSKHMRSVYDANGDGMLAADEYKNGLTTDLNMFDKDGSGGLNLDEFSMMHSAHFREILVDQFQKLDADGDGKVSEEELNGPRAITMAPPMSDVEKMNNDN